MEKAGNKNKKCRYCNNLRYRGILCSKHYSKRKRKLNKTQISANYKKWYYKNKEFNKKRWKIYYTNNKDRLTEAARKYHKTNRKKILKRLKKYRLKNKLRFKLYDSLKRLLLNNFLSKIHKKELMLIYKNCPKTFQVDHIIPLRNANICGLHVPWNLQYLSKRENKTKSNKFDFTYDNNGWRSSK